MVAHKQELMAEVKNSFAAVDNLSKYVMELSSAAPLNGRTVKLGVPTLRVGGEILSSWKNAYVLEEGAAIAVVARGSGVKEVIGGSETKKKRMKMQNKNRIYNLKLFN